MAKPSPATKKAFAIASIIGSALHDNRTSIVKLNILKLQASKAMKVYAKKVGLKEYFILTEQIAQIFEQLEKKHSNEIPIEQMPVFIELICNLIPPDHFKKFLVVSPYSTGSVEMEPAIYASVCNSILELDNSLNKLLNTEPYTLPIRKKKVQKIRQPTIKKKEPTVKKKRQKVIREAKRRKKVKSFLKDRIAKAKENNDNNIEQT